jgi:hypothetical protein
MGRFISASTFTTELVNVSSTPFAATAGKTFLVDTTSTPITLNIPSSADANVGDRITIVDPSGNWASNNVIVATIAGTKIANLDESLILNIPHNSVELLYSGSTYGWVLLNS